MKRNAPSAGKKLSLRVETLRNLSSDEMSQIKGGFINTWCTSVFVPSSGIVFTPAIIMTDCD
ncbi:MAG: hypothetical protein DMF53_02640 [Acidobacteria bacterium]|nr:MAG: hypothetical protein DMF53_02640 [Acidobacteriota bacterium]